MSSPGIYVGIDPGLNGGVGMVAEDSEYPGKVRGATILIDPLMVKKSGKKTKSKEFNIPGMLEFFKENMESISLVVLERAQAMPSQGVTSMFTTGRGFGLWEGILAAYSIPYVLVRPKDWQKKVFSGLAGIGGTTKDKSILFVQKTLPDADLTPGRKRTPHDGLADAVCMGYYGYMMRKGGEL